MRCHTGAFYIGQRQHVIPLTWRCCENCIHAVNVLPDTAGRHREASCTTLTANAWRRITRRRNHHGLSFSTKKDRPVVSGPAHAVCPRWSKATEPGFGERAGPLRQHQCANRHPSPETETRVRSEADGKHVFTVSMMSTTIFLRSGANRIVPIATLYCCK